MVVSVILKVSCMQQHRMRVNHIIGPPLKDLLGKLLGVFATTGIVENRLARVFCDQLPNILFLPATAW